MYIAPEFVTMIFKNKFVHINKLKNKKAHVFVGVYCRYLEKSINITKDYPRM